MRGSDHLFRHIPDTKTTNLQFNGEPLTPFQIWISKKDFSGQICVQCAIAAVLVVNSNYVMH